MGLAFEYIASKGIESEHDYKYLAWDGTCDYNEKKVVAKIGGYKDVEKNDPNALLNAVVDRPVSIAIEADTMYF